MCVLLCVQFDMKRISPEKLLEFLRKNFQVKNDKGREVQLYCPECPDGDTEGKLYVNLRKGVGHCFRCGFSPNFNHTPEATTTSTDISDWEKVRSTFLEDKKSKKADKIYSVDWPEGMEFLPSDCVLGRRAKKYLKKRAFDFSQIVNQFKLGVCNSGKMLGRLILPVFEDGRLVYYTGRTLLGHEKKYLNPDSELVPKGKAEFLFNLDAARLNRTAVIVEGILDAIRVGRNAIALMGKTISDIQLEKLLLAKFEDVLVCLDGDARTEAIELAGVLQPHFSTWIAFLPDNLDPDRLLLKKGKPPKSRKHLFHPHFDGLSQRFHQGLFLMS